MTYLEWAAYHARLFGLTATQQLETVRAWLPVLERVGYSPDELRDASDWLLVHDSPKFWAETPAALSRRVKAVRARTSLAEPEQDGHSRCQDCAGGGLVSVPDLRRVRDGEWLTGHTCAIRCHCWKGREGHFMRRDGVSLMAWDQYQTANPRWREQIARKKHADLELAKISG